MKKLLLTIGLVAAGSAAFGQGTVAFSNTAQFRQSTAQTSDGLTPTSGTASNAPTVLGTLDYGIFFGLGQSTSLTYLSGQTGVNSTSTAGIISNPADNASALSVVAIPGSSPNESDVFLQVYAWSASFGTGGYAAALAAFNSRQIGVFWGQTAIVNINPLGASSGPGAAIWQSSTGTNPHLIRVMDVLTFVPEPSSLALVGFGAAVLTIFRRRK